MKHILKNFVNWEYRKKLQTLSISTRVRVVTIAGEPGIAAESEFMNYW